MKAIEILEWITKESVNGEFLNIIDVPEEGEETFEQNEEWWVNTFGGVPPHPIKPGRYLYFYRSQITDFELLPDAEIELCNTGTMQDYDYINLIKIDDVD